MLELVRITLLLGVAGAAMTFLGSAFTWWMDERRRLERLVRKVLAGKPDGVIIAPGRGAAAGFRLASGRMVVMRDEGADALLYRLHLLIGVELIVDDQVVARVMRGEPRRNLDQVNGGANDIVLRLLFDDARHPDFSLELWSQRDAARKAGRPASAAIREGRSWLGRAEAIMRQVAIQAEAEIPHAPQYASPAPAAPTETFDVHQTKWIPPDWSHGSDEAGADSAGASDEPDDSEEPRLL